MAGTMVVFDFDRTIIDGDSDRWVITEMCLTQLFNELRPIMTWNSLMVCTNLLYSLYAIILSNRFTLWRFLYILRF